MKTFVKWSGSITEQTYDLADFRQPICFVRSYLCQVFSLKFLNIFFFLLANKRTQKKGAEGGRKQLSPQSKHKECENWLQNIKEKARSTARSLPILLSGQTDSLYLI